MEPVSTTLIQNLIKNVISAWKSKSCQQVNIIVVSCSMARVGHSGMTADELTENIEATVEKVAAKIRMASIAWTESHVFIQLDKLGPYNRDRLFLKDVKKMLYFKLRSMLYLSSRYVACKRCCSQWGQLHVQRYSVFCPYFKKDNIQSVPFLWPVKTNMCVPSCNNITEPFIQLYTERTSDKDHPHKESGVGSPPHLHLQPEPPQTAEEGRERGKGFEERSETTLVF